MSGKDAQRGFIYQTIVALIECLKKNDWDEIKLEPGDSNDKFDFDLYQNKTKVSSFQVKSSINEFQKSTVEKWVNELKEASSNTKEIRLYLVGDYFAKDCQKYIIETNSGKKTGQRIIIYQYPFKLDDSIYGHLVNYIRENGLGNDITIKDLDLIYNSLFGMMHQKNISEGPVSRETFARFINDCILKNKKTANTEDNNKELPFHDAITNYINRAQTGINCIQTIATGREKVVIFGENSIYEPVSVRFKESTVSTSTAESLFAEINTIQQKEEPNTNKTINHLLIQAPAGMGKTMLLRWLFLVTAQDIQNSQYLPIFVNLHITAKKMEKVVSFWELLYLCVKEYEPLISKRQFWQSLQNKCYLLLLDGYDEIADKLRDEITIAIECFCAAFPNNSCIITTRPEANTANLHSFFQAELISLTEKQSFSLSDRLTNTRKGRNTYQKALEFCKLLRKGLFKQYPDYTGSPLLLSIMHLVYSESGVMPQDSNDFYNQAFEVLYKANYMSQSANGRAKNPREFESSSLTKTDFRRLFSRFCFQSYFKTQYEFEEKTILDYFKSSITKYNYNCSAEDVLSDLLSSICLIIQDGNRYRFLHRSFQEYFSALYCHNELTDEDQIILFREMFSNPNPEKYNSFFRFLLALDEKRFIKNALEKVIREIHDESENSDCPNLCFLRLVAPTGSGWVQGHAGVWINLNMTFLPTEETQYRYNIVKFFSEYKLADLFLPKNTHYMNADGFLRSTAPNSSSYPAWMHRGNNDALLSTLAYFGPGYNRPHFYDIPSSEEYCHDEYFNREFGRYFFIENVRKEISETLSHLDDMDNSSKLISFVSEL